jgi:YARHG domain
VYTSTDVHIQRPAPQAAATLDPKPGGKAMRILKHAVSMVVRRFERKENITVTGARSCSLALVIIAGIASIQPARAEGDECISLYVKRNQIYADAHYCFKTEKALQYFSNSGCIPGEPRLTSSQQRQIAEIQKEEKRYCRQ